MTLTVKDFAKTLKIKDDALLERMKLAGLYLMLVEMYC